MERKIFWKKLIKIRSKNRKKIKKSSEKIMKEVEKKFEIFLKKVEKSQNQTIALLGPSTRAILAL